jgi:hypothetical protein
MVAVHASRAVSFGDGQVASTWAAIPTDKDGGFCLVDKFDLAADYRTVLATSDYHARHWTPSVAEELLEEYVFTCKRAAEWAGDEGPLLTALLSSARHTKPKVLGMLMFTVKTHKPMGAVTFRAIHASGNLAYAPGYAVHH